MVEINLVFRDEELLAYLGPVSIFVLVVLVEQRRTGKRRRGTGELGNEISAQGGDGGKAASCSREETAAVESKAPPWLGTTTLSTTTAMVRLGLEWGKGRARRSQVPRKFRQPDNP
jgi:hypothetical protein